MTNGPTSRRCAAVPTTDALSVQECACAPRPGRRRFGFGLGPFVAAAVLGIVGCSSEKRETASLVAAVDRFHQAENREKPAAADFLATLPCSERAVCEAKDACVKAAAATAQALRLMAEAQAGLADLKANKLSPDDERAKGLSGKLSEATRLLEEGHAAMPACDALVTKLKFLHGV